MTTMYCIAQTPFTADLQMSLQPLAAGSAAGAHQ
jgi:hypothetical protein